MSALAIDMGGYNTDIKDDTPGFSESASQIDKYESEFFGRFEEVYAKKTGFDVLENRIIDAYFFCNRPNWDGYGAKPLSIKSANFALSFFRRLSSAVPAPEVSPEPDGEVALDWCSDDGDMFSLSFSDGGLVNFAGTFADGVEIHGVDRESPEFIATISRYIEKVLF